MAHPGGRPLKFQTPEELQEKVDLYFEKCDKTGEPYAITGLALALDTDRATLCNYGNREEYADIIFRAKLRVEHAYELRLIDKGRSGDIFALKNFNWTDRQEVDNNITLSKSPVDELVESIKGFQDEDK